MTNFIQKRLKKLLNSPYKIHEVESAMKRLTSVCANLSEKNVSHRIKEERGDKLNLILRGRHDAIISGLRIKANFEEQKYFVMKCLCECDRELKILKFIRDTGDHKLGAVMLATLLKEDDSLAQNDDSITLESRSVAFVIVECTVLTLVLAELYSVKNFQSSKIAEVSGNLTRWFISYHSGADNFSIKRPLQEDFLKDIEDKVDGGGMEKFLSAIEMGNLSGALNIANTLMENRA